MDGKSLEENLLLFDAVTESSSDIEETRSVDVDLADDDETNSVGSRAETETI